jgi:hypothetical protein
VLAISEEADTLKEVRLKKPLSQMKKSGLIADFAIVNSFLEGGRADFAFNVVWLQRIANEILVEFLFDKLGGCFIYDIDDLLLISPPYIKTPCPPFKRIHAGLRLCSVLTTPSRRLVGLLERYSGLNLQSKAVACPNACDFAPSLRGTEVPQGILWASSDHAALMSSRSAVVKSLARFSSRHGLPLYSIGNLEEDIKSKFASVVDLGLLPYHEYMRFFAESPTMLGVAPLETDGDKTTLDFISGKSDIKLVEFVGFGHPCVCSCAPPYIDTDLDVGLKVENTEEAWLNGLDQVYRHAWKDIGAEQTRVQSSRHIDIVAGDYWYEAVRRARIPNFVALRELRLALNKIGLWRTLRMEQRRFVRNWSVIRAIKTYVPIPLLKVLRELL